MCLTLLKIKPDDMITREEMRVEFNQRLSAYLRFESKLNICCTCGLISGKRLTNLTYDVSRSALLEGHVCMASIVIIFSSFFSGDSTSTLRFFLEFRSQLRIEGEVKGSESVQKLSKKQL